MRDPVTGVSYSVIYARLPLLSTTVASRHQSYQSPSSFMFHHERSPTVPLAGVLAPVVVASAHHLVVDDDVDALVSVPLLALPVVYHGDVHHLHHEVTSLTDTPLC